MTSEDKRDYEEMGIFMGKHERGFKVQIRWSAQQELITEIMTGSYYVDIVGYNSTKQALSSSIRIAAQSEVRRLMFEALGWKQKEKSQVQCMDALSDEQIQKIKESLIDWTYDVTPKADTTEKKKKSATDFLDKMSPEERKEFLAKYM